MDVKFKFAVLTLSGTVCVLAALVAMAYMYHLHAAQIFMPTPYGATPATTSFAVFVGIPALATFLVGIMLIVATRK